MSIGLEVRVDMIMLIKTRTSCRVCGSKKLIPILSLGNQFVTNFVEDPKGDYPKGPLDLVLCNVKDVPKILVQVRNKHHDGQSFG